MSSILTVVCPLTPASSTCGYCSPPGERSATKSSYHAAELIPMQLSCEAYQIMIDRGWRRSGTYCYKPDLLRSCCPQYTIKLDALAFKPSKGQRKLVNRFNRFAISGGEGGSDVPSTDDPIEQKGSSTKRKGKKPVEKNQEFILKTNIHAAEVDFLGEEHTVHKFEVILEASSYTQEKFALYQSYQQNIHHEKEKSPDGFNRFLVETPLAREPIPYPKEPPTHLPKEYGAYHQLYRLDGELIALGVIDLLPNCVSSVYFMYEKKWERFSLGRISALREASLAREIHDAGIPDMEYLYMGFYIQSCVKMRYKGDYSPSFLADPEEYTWHPLEKCKPLLEKHRYACFSHPEHSVVGTYKGPAHDPRWPTSELLELRLLDEVMNGGVSVIPVTSSPKWQKAPVRRAITSVADALGPALAKEAVFHLAYVIR